MGRKELEDELRELRKTAGAKPISKMKLVDISVEIERMKNGLQSTPNAVATRASPHKGKESSVETIQEAREQEFPVRPAKVKAEKKSVASKKAPASTPKMSKKALMKMLSEVSDTDEE